MVINGFTNELSWKADEIPGGTCHELASHLRGRYNTSSGPYVTDLMPRKPGEADMIMTQKMYPSPCKAGFSNWARMVAPLPLLKFSSLAVGWNKLFSFSESY